jgi:hypothetical protein
MLREDRVERLHDARLWQLLLKLLGAAGREAHGEIHVGIECVRRVDDRFACQCFSGRLHDVVDRAKGNGNYDQLCRACRTADGCAVVSNGAYLMTSTLEPASERATDISVSNDSDLPAVVSYVRFT